MYNYWTQEAVNDPNSSFKFVITHYEYRCCFLNIYYVNLFSQYFHNNSSISLTFHPSDLQTDLKADRQKQNCIYLHAMRYLKTRPAANHRAKISTRFRSRHDCQNLIKGQNTVRWLNLERQSTRSAPFIQKDARLMPFAKATPQNCPFKAPLYLVSVFDKLNDDEIPVRSVIFVEKN